METRRLRTVESTAAETIQAMVVEHGLIGYAKERTGNISDAHHRRGCLDGPAGDAMYGPAGDAEVEEYGLVHQTQKKRDHTTISEIANGSRLGNY
jgi:hypothetical protein